MHLGVSEPHTLGATPVSTNQGRKKRDLEVAGAGPEGQVGEKLLCVVV